MIMACGDRSGLVNAASISQPSLGLSAELWPRELRRIFFSLLCALKSGDLGTKQGIVKEEGSGAAAPASVSPNYLVCDVQTLRRFARKRLQFLSSRVGVAPFFWIFPLPLDSFNQFTNLTPIIAGVVGKK
jgi:hypothetical protein